MTATATYPAATRIRRIGPDDERFVVWQAEWRRPTGRWGVLFRADTEAEARAILESHKQGEKT